MLRRPQLLGRLLAPLPAPLPTRLPALLATLLATAALAAALLVTGRPAHALGPPGVVPPDDRAPLLDGLEGHANAIESRRPLVRRFFDQGMLLAYAFNPAEAARSLRMALAIDPACASCWWALAWALGPTINADMAAQDAAVVEQALLQARRHAARASPLRRELIAALSLRHRADGRLDEEAYAARLQAVARQHPRSADAALLAAEALMNLHPYDWWTTDGRPQPWTPAIETLLQRAMRLQPRHPGAHHYWIHLQESSPQPARAQASADFLREAFAGAPHLLHMPSHIDMRVGRYEAAIQANLRSIAADRRYLQQLEVQGAYRVGYVAHNHHFLWAAASMAGRSQLAQQAADAAWPAACGPSGRDPGSAIASHYAALPYFTRVRFGQWPALLRETPPPDAPGPYVLAIWHYARGTAHARTGGLPEAQRELDALERLARDPALAAARVKNINPALQLLRIATLTLRADIASARQQPLQAVALLREATAIEDAFSYDEPHLWLAPTRHALGAALLDAGEPVQAEQVYRQDLAHYPGNGWSLRGLALALAQQGRDDDARAAREQAAAAFAGAEGVPPGSRF